MPERTKSLKQVVLASPSTSKVVRMSHVFPGINDPENEKPSTVLLPVEVVKPAVAAAPPEAEITSTPFTLN